MLIYYLVLIFIALLIDAVFILKIHISKIAYNDKGLKYFCYGIFVFGFIDILWGMMYYDFFGLGVLAHIVSSSLFFLSSVVLSYGWMLYASNFIEDKKISKKKAIISAIPAIFINVLVVINIWTEQLFTMENTTLSYERGSWYIIYRLVIYGYYITVILKAVNSFRKAKKNSRKYIAILAFAITPLLIESLQSVDSLLPFTTLAYVMAILVAYIFIYTESETELTEDLTRTFNEKMQAIEESNKAKTTFLFNMSHDIRTPMNSILGFNEIARRNIDNKEKVMEALDKAKVSGEHMLGIINDILEMSKIESGKLEINDEVINVKEHIISFRDMFEISMKEKGIDFKVIDETEAPYIYGDYLRITQVVVNLLSNAMKFTPAGGEVIYRCTEKSCAMEGYVSYEISVKDSGIGMSSEFQNKVFELFEREKTSATSGIQGTGLGLAIAKRLSLLMGGDLYCKSKIGKGTEFVFNFNARLAKYGKEIIQKAELREVILKGKRILVVDDNDLNREITSEILGVEGCIIEEAENGKVAVEKISSAKERYYDLVLMDIQMPVMDGYEAVENIRAIENKELAHIPVIAMTANAFEEDKKRALEAGMDAYVSKPIDIDKFFESMIELLKNEE